MDFDQEEILNYDLLTYLISNRFENNYFEYLKRFITQLKKTWNSDFVESYFDITSELPYYVKILNIVWPNLFNEILNNDNFSENQIHKYSMYSIYYSDDDTLELINKDNCLSDYISNKYDYLAIEEPDIDKLIHGFKLLNVSFANVIKLIMLEFKSDDISADILF